MKRIKRFSEPYHCKYCKRDLPLTATENYACVYCEELKVKIFDWLKENNITGKKIRVYAHKRYGLEVRIYGKPMEMPNRKKSRRKMPVDENGFNCTYGIHSKKISTYAYINADTFISEEEKQFTLEIIKGL